ncbi:polysaccharide lyase family 7 protein [Lewinella sp. JB7]|uniref:polysaccharide lyase family 7 protein n=1 Tax=Lewinella sp. JB7 TaxID=2962887 RepID=UPI0020C93EB1|nr:polysaccharide lyase family 7 protein [Lewinella sp. JB7]MCP9236975.1 polysaccharide lyase family 7 protein [Lewinella sp. JB7]
MHRNLFIGLLLIALLGCGEKSIPRPAGSTETEVPDNTPAHGIDLSHWKLTLPIGAPTEIEPPEILNYAQLAEVKPYMYDDTTDGSLVFYATPGASTANSSYSRSELREQMQPGSNSVNWTFAQGGRMRAKLAVPEVSRDASGDPHRVIVLQIHGRLTNEQRDLIGEDDNNAPPIMKVYWQKGYVRLKSKYLKDPDATYEELLHTDAWGDDEGYTFPEEVGTDPFTVEIVADAAGMRVTLNDKETHTYTGFDMDKWGAFENYFKAGNYLQARESDAFARVKFYELTVTH